MIKLSLDDDQIKLEVLSLKSDGISASEISKRLGISRSTLYRFLSKESYKQWWEQNTKPIASGTLFDHHKNIKTFKENVFVITSAQNNTFVNDAVYKTLMNVAKHRKAKVLVGTFSYNKNGFQNLEKSNGASWFDPKITPYIYDEPAYLANDLIWCGELNILPTAVNPLSGFHSYTKSCSGIIPHAKVQMKSLPRHKSQDPRLLYTTGTVTKQNYIQKKEGQKAAFHHIYGGLIVEVDSDGDWFVRHLIADKNGNIQDLDTIYTPEGWATGNRIVGVNYGDLHSEKKDDDVYDVLFRKKDSLLDTLMPQFQFCHDVLDFEARNHHTISDPYKNLQLFVEGKDSVENNINDVIGTLKQMNRSFCKTVVVESNHDLALKRWLKTSDYKTDPKNAIFFLECQLEIYKSIKEGKRDFSIFEHVVKQKEPSLKDVKFLKTDESFMICNESREGIECGSHGDLGVNGARGSINAYARSGTRYNVGHSHSPEIVDGVYQAGTSGKMNKGYNVGNTTWVHASIVTYQTGKRTIIIVKNKKYKGKLND